MGNRGLVVCPPSTSHIDIHTTTREKTLRHKITTRHHHPTPLDITTKEVSRHVDQLRD